MLQLFGNWLYPIRFYGWHRVQRHENNETQLTQPKH